MKYTLRVWDSEGNQLGFASSDFIPCIVAFGFGLPNAWRRNVEYMPPPPEEGRLLTWDQFLALYHAIPPVTKREAE